MEYCVCFFNIFCLFVCLFFALWQQISPLCRNLAINSTGLSYLNVKIHDNTVRKTKQVRFLLFGGLEPQHSKTNMTAWLRLTKAFMQTRWKWRYHVIMHSATFRARQTPHISSRAPLWRPEHLDFNAKTSWTLKLLWLLSY